MEINGTTPFGLAARSVITKLSSQITQNMPGVIGGNDVTALHDARVASRRLRAVLRVFRKCLPRSHRQAVEQQAQLVTQSLGQVRDQDVFIEFLLCYIREHRGSDLDWLLAWEHQIRKEARIHMLDAVRHIDIGTTDGSLAQLLDEATMTSPDEKNAFALQAARLLKPRLDEVESTTTSLDNHLDTAGHHALRIAAKRLRYTMEAFLPCFGERLNRQIAKVKLLQEHLGLVHDCDVWLDKLEQYMRDPGLPDDHINATSQLMANLVAIRYRHYRAAREHWSCRKAARLQKRLLQLVCGDASTDRAGRKSKHLGQDTEAS